jgi:hypothetical protein
VYKRQTLERKIPARERRWEVTEASAVYGSSDEPLPQGWPVPAE